VYMGNDLVREVQRDEGHIFEAIQVALSSCDDRLGPFVDQVIHDGKIVGGEIPYDIDVVLKEAEVDTGRVVVVQLAEGIFVQQFSDFAYRTSEQKSVVHHYLQVLLFSQFDQFLSLGSITGKWFLHENVL